MIRKVSRSALTASRRPHVHFFSSSRRLCSQNYTAATALTNINTSLSPLQDSSITKGVDTSKPLSSQDISRILQSHCQNQSSPIPLDAVISSMVHSLSTSSTEPPMKQLSHIATIITNSGKSVNLTALLNYGTLISLLPSSLYKSLPVWHRYRIYHQPHITTCSLESLSTRIDKLMLFLREMDTESTTEEDVELLRKIMRTDLVETITDCLKMGAQDYALAFLDYYDRQYGMAPLEDIHTWFYEALDSACPDVVSHLLKNAKLVDNLPQLEKELALLNVVQHGDVDTALKIWNRDDQMTSYRASMVVQLLGGDDIDQCIELMDYIQPALSEDLQINDFNFVIDLMKQELKTIGKERQTRLKDSKEKKDYGSPGDVKRPDIQTLLNRHDIFNKPYDNAVKSIYANLLLKTVSELTNTTGVIFLYTAIPLQYFNSLSYQILFRCCERGADGSLRAFELFRFATSKGIVIPETAFASLFKTSVANEEEFIFYLANYFQRYDQFSIYTRTRLSYMLKYKWVPLLSQELIESLLDSPSPKDIITNKLQNDLPIDFLSAYQPTKHKTHYDLRESTMLKRHHNSSIY